MTGKDLWPDHDMSSSADGIRIAETLQRAIALFPEEWAAAAARVRAGALVDDLVNVSPGAYDHTASSLLAAASAWAYSDNEEVIRMMERRGFSNVCVTVKFNNQGFLMDSLAHFALSRDGRVGILVFRGSQLQPLTNWLANINMKTEAFYAAGRVHGGFHRGILSVWSRVKHYLVAAQSGESICRASERDAINKRCAQESSAEDVCVSCGEDSGLSKQAAEFRRKTRLWSMVGALEDALRFKMEALYITGHSLGGALAVLAAALIYSDEKLRELRPLLRGIYTFGQPMVGDRAFATKFQREFGDRLFRHVYRRDVIPHLPPRSAGVFEHFGQEYSSSIEGWINKRGPTAGQVRIGGVAMLGSALSWLEEQFSPRGLLPDLGPVEWLAKKIVPPLLREPLLLGYSLGDHMPINYLRASRGPVPGSEFL
ncbi:lipase family protein [Sorangium sp. So ce204]|uniref:lipase family protein n=1 Tax=Sorangium sp. So ce204 TaxID=3133288 RepID=UPI003F61B926